jgi:SulP family sulfate permease
VTAVVAGVLAAFFGGSAVQVSGPTGAMAVVLVPIVAQFGAEGVMVVGLMAGVILVGLGLARLGRWMRYVPLPVVEGFTIGIAAIIALQQVPAALGVEVEGEQVVGVAAESVRTWVSDPSWAAVGVTVAVTGVILVGARLRPGLPVSLPAVVVASLVTAAAGLDVATIGALPSGLPGPDLPGLGIADMRALLFPAVAVAALAALESLLSASVADAMRVGERHDPDRELVGQGIANLGAPLFGGMPATAAIARTAVNVRSGATSRLAAIAQSAVLLLVVTLAGRWVSGIPLAALAGVLIATTVQMVDASSVRALLGATRGDAAVLVVTATATIAFDLVAAVVLGLLVAGGSALRQIARSARIDEVALDMGDHVDEEQALLHEHIVAYRLDGPLFFGAAHTFLLELAELSDVRVVILRMSRVATIDATGAAVLADTIARLESRHITVLLSGVRPEHHAVLQRLGVHDRLAHERHVFARTPAAIQHARLHAGRVDHTPGSPTHTGGDAATAGDQPPIRRCGAPGRRGSA